MTATDPQPAIGTSRWRRLLGSPLVWASVCAAIALPWFVSGAGMEFFPFLLAIVAGWACGFSFVNATGRAVRMRRAVALHVFGAVASAALVVVGAEFGGPFAAALPEPLGAVVLFLQFAAIPAAGWVWLALLARLVEAVGRRSPHRVPVVPAWEREGDAAMVRFAAVPMRSRTLSLLIGVTAAVGGALAFALLVVLDDAVLRLGARLSIILVGVLIALPLHLLIASRLRRLTRPCWVRLDGERLEIGVGGVRHGVPLRELEVLVWRPRSEYARVEARGGGLDVSLVVGVARTPNGVAAELPEPTRHVRRTLEDAGLRLERAPGGRVLAFRRTS